MVWAIVSVRVWATVWVTVAAIVWVMVSGRAVIVTVEGEPVPKMVVVMKESWTLPVLKSMLAVVVMYFLWRFVYLPR